MASIIGALDPHVQDHLHLRLHRARSVVLTDLELVEIRASQRTFEGAYLRTAISQLSFSLIILKIFNSDFYAIGALFAGYGAAIMMVAIYRRYEGNRQFFDTEHVVTADDRSAAAAGLGAKPVTKTSKFRTSANSVAMLTLLSLAAYVTLVVLTWRLDS